MRYRLRTLMILLAIMPPILWFGHVQWQRWQERQQIKKMLHVLQADQARQISAWRAVLMSQPMPPPADTSN